MQERGLRVLLLLLLWSLFPFIPAEVVVAIMLTLVGLLVVEDDAINEFGTGTDGNMDDLQ